MAESEYREREGQPDGNEHGDLLKSRAIMARPPGAVN